MHRPLLMLGLFLFGAAAQAAPKNQPKLSVILLPGRDVALEDQDRVLATLARQIRGTYDVQVLSGRCVGRAVFGTRGTGLDECAAEFGRKVAEGRKAYLGLQINRALDRLREALALEGYCGAEVRAAAELRDLHLFLGLSLYARGDARGAAEQFRLLVAHDPNFALSPKEYPPDTLAAFDKARREILSGRPVQLQIVSRPEGAVAYLDGAAAGRTPVSDIPVYPGHHFVRIELAGHAPWTLHIPEGVAPDVVRAQLVQERQKQTSAELLEIIGPSESLSAPLWQELRDIGRHLDSSGLMFVQLSRDGPNLLLGMRLVSLSPESAARARMFNLGNRPDGYEKKLQALVKILDALRKLRPLEAEAMASSGPAVPTGPVVVSPPRKTGGDDFIPLPPSGIAGPAVPKDDRRHGREDEREETRPSTPWYKSWWFWTIAGAVVAGGAAGLSIWLLQPKTTWTLVIQP